MTLLTLLTPRTSYSVQHNYTQAVDKAKEAAYIQSGLSARVGEAKAMGEKAVKHFAMKAGIEREFGASLYLYKCYRDQAVRFRYKSITYTLKLDRVQMEIPF